MAKILIVTHDGSGIWFSLRFKEEKHDVDIYWAGKAHDDGQYALGGLCPEIIHEEPDFSKYDLVMFDQTDKPKIADKARSLAPTVGDSDFATEIENNRLVGIQMMEDADINVPEYETFDSVSEAKSFINKTRKRYVFKPFGGPDQDTANTYVSKSPEDLIKYLDTLEAIAKGVKFILQEVVNGTEVSTEGWFNGKDFHLLNGTLEEKKFMDGGRGPNTGCSGNLVFPYDSLNPPLIFREGLGKMKEILQQVQFVGPIDLNAIVSDITLYGLEWTPRFGYDAAPTLFHIIESELGEFLYQVATGELPTPRIKNPYAMGIRVSIPPYPSEIKGHHAAEIPIEGLEKVKDIWRSYYLFDCCCSDASGDLDKLCTAGINGFVCVPIASGQTIPEAYDKMMYKTQKLQIPNMQYRGDLLKCFDKRYKDLRMQGWLR
jgi:phosphoribosylamine--glycine ligase